MEEFPDWCGTDFFLHLGGSMDLTELQRNMSYYGMELPFPKPLFFRCPEAFQHRVFRWKDERVPRTRPWIFTI